MTSHVKWISEAARHFTELGTWGNDPEARGSRLVGASLSSLVQEMKDLKVTRANTYLKAKGIDLTSFQPNYGQKRKSKVAASLDISARYYLDQETAHTTLVAFRIAQEAETAEETRA